MHACYLLIVNLLMPPREFPSARATPCSVFIWWIRFVTVSLWLFSRVCIIFDACMRVGCSGDVLDGWRRCGQGLFRESVHAGS
jgi:hypothetical protein